MMKKNALLFLLAITLTLGLFSSGHEAQAASPAPSFSTAVGLCPACAAKAECLRACLEAFKKDLEDAKSACMYCSFSVFGICVAKTANPNCIKSMHEKAEELYDACKDACRPPVPDPQPVPAPKP